MSSSTSIFGLLGLDARKLGVNDEVAVVTDDVDRRRPCALTAAAQLVEHAIEAGAQLRELGERHRADESSRHYWPPWWVEMICVRANDRPVAAPNP